MSLSKNKIGPLDRGLRFVFWTRWEDKEKGKLRKVWYDPDRYCGFVYNLLPAHPHEGVPEKADRLNKPTFMRIMKEARYERPRGEHHNALVFYKMVQVVLCKDFDAYLVRGVMAWPSMPAAYKSGMGVTHFELLEEHEIRVEINRLDIAYAKGGADWQALLEMDVAQAREMQEVRRQQKLCRRREGFVITSADEVEAEFINSR